MRLGLGVADLTEDVHALFRESAFESVEVRGSHGVLGCGGNIRRQRDDGHAALRIVGVVLGGLALVRHQGVCAVRGDSDHVGKCTDANFAEDGTELVRAGIEEDQLAVVRLILRLDGGHRQAVTSHRDRIDGGVLAAGDLADLCGSSRIRGVQHVDLPAERIDGEDALGARVERDDLRRRFVERASAVRAEHRDIGRSAVSDLFYRLAYDGCPGVLRQAERECGGAGRSEAGAGNGGR